MIAFLIYKLILCVVVFAISLGIAAYSTLWERKLSALLQDRVGPDRAGPFGLLQPLADGGKMFFKEEIIPNVSNRFLFVLGPSLVMLTALMTGAVIPWAKDVYISGHLYSMQITDINIGVLYLFGVVSVGVYGIMIGGWASNNKYALLGAIRASSQMISYEIAMGITVIASAGQATAHNPQAVQRSAPFSSRFKTCQPLYTAATGLVSSGYFTVALRLNKWLPVINIPLIMPGK